MYRMPAGLLSAPRTTREVKNPYFCVDITPIKVYYNTCKEVIHMSKKKKKGKNKALENIVFATAILNLIYTVVELLKELLN